MTGTYLPYPLWELLGPPSEFGRPERTAVRAERTGVQFADGRWRLCATSGLWNVNIGYGNRRIAEAVGTALLDASYLTLFRGGHTPAVAAARALLAVSGGRFGRVVFSTSGSAANDLVMKLVRQHWALLRQYSRRIVVGFSDSYHGLTYGSHGLTGMALGQDYYGVDRRQIRHVSHSDPAELRELLRQEGDRVAAVVAEPVLGTGAHPLPPEMLQALAELRGEYGFLLVADEVATGFGRTGPFFASDRWPVMPDVLIASKGITNGTCAVAAVLVSHGICETFDRRDAVFTHAETQAGTPATCAAILATIEEMDRIGALEKSEAVGERLGVLLNGLTDAPFVTETGGTGCFRALRLGFAGEPLSNEAVRTVLDEIRQAGVLAQVGPSCIQVVPAFVYSDGEFEQLAAALRHGLEHAAEQLAPSLEGR